MEQENIDTASILDKNLDHLPVKNSRRSLDVLLGVLAVFLVGLSAFLYLENTNLKKQLGISPKSLFPKSCVQDGVTYQPGEQVPGIDSCNTCACDGESGLIACTGIACDVPNLEENFVPSQNWTTYTDPVGIFSLQYPDNMFFDSQNRNFAIHFQDPAQAANLTGMQLDVHDETAGYTKLSEWFEIYLTSGSVVNTTLNRSLVETVNWGGVEGYRINPDSAPENISHTVYLALVNGVGYELILSDDIDDPIQLETLNQILSTFEFTK